MGVTVLKLGGSLLDLGDLPDRLRSLFKTLGSGRPLLVCGGGDAADVARRWHEVHRFDEEPSHWLALDAVAFNQRLLLTLLPELELVCNRDAAESVWNSGRVPLLDLKTFVCEEESQPGSGLTCLPHTWEVTSDSLAGWVAIRWPASQFVLLKSTVLPSRENRWSLHDVADAGFVDRCFPKLGPDLPSTFWCDLRNHREAEFLRLTPS